MSKKCVNCGAELEDGAVFCDECGVQQSKEQSQMRSNEKSSENNYQLNQTNIAVTSGKNTGMGIASLVCGVIAICTLGGFIIPEILGIIFGIIAIRDKTAKNGLPIAGLVMSIISLLLLVLIMVLI